MIRLHLSTLRLRCLLRRGHAYTYRATPPSCARCGTTMRHVKVKIVSVDGSHVEMQDFDQDSLMSMIEAMGDDDIHVIAVAMDDGMAYLVKRNIVRIDVD